MKRQHFEAIIMATARDYAAWFAEHHPELFEEETTSSPATEPTALQPPVAAPESPTPNPEEASAAADEKPPTAVPTAAVAFRQRRARFRL